MPTKARKMRCMVVRTHVCAAAVPSHGDSLVYVYVTPPHVCTWTPLRQLAERLAQCRTHAHQPPLVDCRRVEHYHTCGELELNSVPCIDGAKYYSPPYTHDMTA